MHTDLEKGEEPHGNMYKEALGDNKAEGVAPPAGHQVQVAMERSPTAVLHEDGVADRGRHPGHGQECVGADPGAGRVAEEKGGGQQEVDGLEPPRHGARGDAACVCPYMVWFYWCRMGVRGRGRPHD